MSVFDRQRRGEIVVPHLMEVVFRDREKWHSNANDIWSAKKMLQFYKDDLYQFENVESNPAYRDFFHPSSAGNCLRQQWFNRIGMEQADDDDLEAVMRRTLIFETGDFLHLKWNLILARAGLLIEREIPFVLTAEHMVGKADAVVEVPGHKGQILVDYKGLNSRSTAMSISNGKPSDGYIIQLNTYMGALRRNEVGKKHKINQGCILIENKDTQVPTEFPIKYSDKLFKETMRRKDELFARVESLEPPDPEFHDKRTFPCSFCGFKGVCESKGVIRRVSKQVREERERAKDKKPKQIIGKTKVGKSTKGKRGGRKRGGGGLKFAK